MPGEFDFIDWIRARSRTSERVLVPPGDDLAVLKWDVNDLLIVGVDQVLDSVHFDSRVHSARDIGRKVMNRNLSDCAAMACLPAAAVATAALPRGTPLEYAKELHLGMSEAAAPFDCPIVGGDTGSWDGKLVLTVTILGRSAGIQPITRRGAKIGDGIYVTGSLGGSILGRHMTFSPRVALARELAQTGTITSMIDLSDGLSRDLRHICQQSGVGAVVEADLVPIHADAAALSHKDGLPPLQHALHDGEDYELLFTSPTTPRAGIYIGRIVEGGGPQLRTKSGAAPLEPRGWEHRL
jgi:thiamine-monophosphate kinase